MRVRPISTPKRRIIGVVLAAGLCVTSIGVLRRGPHSSGVAPSRGPNVVLVVIDTLRADHLNHYGYDRPTAASLDDFAAEATRFDAAFSPSSWTMPSTASLHTGLLPSRHGLTKIDGRLDDHLTTLAETLHAAGWHTYGHSDNCNVQRASGFAQGFDEFDDFLGEALAYPDVSIMIDRVTSWLADRPPTPFFLYLHVMNAHGPYRVPMSSRTVLLGHAPSQAFSYYGAIMRGILSEGRLAARTQVSPAYLESLTDKYDTAIRYTTDQIARVISALRAADVYDQSLVILTADHGEELFDHGGFSHGYSLHRETVRVPLYVKLPGQHEGRAVRQRASLIDVAATVLDVLGLPPPRVGDGHSLRPWLSGASAADRPAQHRVLLHEIDWPSRCVARAIVSGHYKLIEIERDYSGRHDAELLFDVARDPLERTDLAARFPKRVARLRAELARRMERARATAVGPNDLEVRPVDVERLHALGYL